VSTPIAEPVAQRANKSRRNLWIIPGAGALVALLGGAAFVAGRLLSPNPAGANSGKAGLNLRFSGPGGKVNGAIALGETRAKELPSISLTVVGVLVSHQDQLLQVVAPGSLDDLGANSIITAWGSRQGDRITADVLLNQ
jgi:hypothetical protein